MKTNNRSVIKKSLLGIFSAAAIMLGSVLPAFAAEGSTVAGDSYTGQFTKAFQLELPQLPSGVEADKNVPDYFKSPEVSFSFYSGEVPAEDASEKGTKGQASLAYVMKSQFNTTDIDPVRPTDSSKVPQYLLIGTSSDTASAGTVHYNLGEAAVSTTDSAGNEIPGKEKTVTISLPENQTFRYPGVYYYQFHEKQDNIPGITYDNSTYYIIVSVENNLSCITTLRKDNDNSVKNKDIINKYTAGALSFSKSVQGNIGDNNKTFTVAVKLDGDPATTYTVHAIGKGVPDVTDGAYNQELSWTGGKTETFSVKNGTTYTLYNIPNGVIYSVYETNQERSTDGSSDKYTVDSYALSYNISSANGASISNAITDAASTENNTVYGVTGTVEGANNYTVGITNTRETTFDTGVFTSNLPYFIILITAAGGLVIFLVSRKHHV
jgi:hypothetical protein